MSGRPSPNNICNTSDFSPSSYSSLEVESVPHVEQVLQRDCLAVISGGLPLRDRRRCVQHQPVFGYQHADHGMEHGLGHRPREQRKSPGGQAFPACPIGAGDRRSARRRVDRGCTMATAYVCCTDPSGSKASVMSASSATPSGRPPTGQSPVGHGTSAMCTGSGSRGTSSGSGVVKGSSIAQRGADSSLIEERRPRPHRWTQPCGGCAPA